VGSKFTARNVQFGANSPPDPNKTETILGGGESEMSASTLPHIFTLYPYESCYEIGFRHNNDESICNDVTYYHLDLSK
jgi:hypothetical protein